MGRHFYRDQPSQSLIERDNLRLAGSVPCRRTIHRFRYGISVPETLAVFDIISLARSPGRDEPAAGSDMVWPVVYPSSMTLFRALFTGMRRITLSKLADELGRLKSLLGHVAGIGVGSARLRLHSPTVAGYAPARTRSGSCTQMLCKFSLLHTMHRCRGFIEAQRTQ